MVIHSIYTKTVMDVPSIKIIDFSRYLGELGGMIVSNLQPLYKLILQNQEVAGALIGINLSFLWIADVAAKHFDCSYFNLDEKLTGLERGIKHTIINSTVGLLVLAGNHVMTYLGEIPLTSKASVSIFVTAFVVRTIFDRLIRKDSCVNIRLEIPSINT